MHKSQLVTALILGSLSIYLLCSYFNPVRYYPFPENTTLYIINSETMVQKVDFPLEERVVSKYYPDSHDEQLYVANFESEFFSQDNENVDAGLSRIPLSVANVFNPQLKLNGLELQLLKQNISYPNKIKSIDSCTRDLVKEWETAPHYVIPRLNLSGNEKVNVVELSYEFKLDAVSKSSLFVTPFPFQSKTYSKTFSLPPAAISVIISPNSPSVHTKTTFELAPNSFYEISSKESGWYSEYTNLPNNTIGIGYSYVPKSILTQVKNSDEGRLSSEINLTENNVPAGFLISLIPNLKVFLLPLIFLWVPFIFDFWSERTLWKKIAECYAIIASLIVVPSLLGLSSFELLIKGFDFYESWFIILVYLFPIIYLVRHIIYQKVTRQKSSPAPS